VDPVALGIPTYFDIIPRKDARDLKTIRQRLDTDKYDSIEAFEADVGLMVQNAITFNGAESEVGKMAALVGDKFKELLVNVKNGTVTGKKRKDADGANKGVSQPPKKLKIG
jgi:transcription initiation factor TFIID subunit 2